MPTWWQFFRVFSSLSLVWRPSMLILKYSSSTCVCTSADLISLFSICVEDGTRRELFPSPWKRGCDTLTSDLLLLLLGADVLVSLHEVEQSFVLSG